MPICHYCGSEYRRNGTILCNECRELYDQNMLLRCDGCHNFMRRGDEGFHEGFTVYCKNCVDHHMRTCAICGERQVYWMGIVDRDGNFYCHKHELQLCTECNTVHDYRSMVHLSDSVICQDCAATEKYKYYVKVYKEDLLKRFDWRPDTYKKEHNHEVNKVFLGFELEAGFLTSEARQMKALVLVNEALQGHGYTKHDGSIPHYGFEVVSQPMTLAVHRCTQWDKVLNTMRSVGMHTEDGEYHDTRGDGSTLTPCGLHVHVSRDALTYRQWIILDRMIQHYSDMWEVLSRREASNYCRFKGVPSSRRRSIKRFYGISDNRYEAINFCNCNTVEFRMFNSTLDYDTLMATLEVVHAAVNWAANVSTATLIKSNMWSDFIRTVNKPAKYPYASKYVTKLFNLDKKYEKEPCI